MAKKDEDNRDIFEKALDYPVGTAVGAAVGGMAGRRLARKLGWRGGKKAVAVGSMGAMYAAPGVAFDIAVGDIRKKTRKPRK